MYYPEVDMSEIVKVGVRVKICIPKKLMTMLKIRPGDRVRITVLDEYRLLIEKELSVEDVLSNYIAEITPDEAEKISEEKQKEFGLYRNCFLKKLHA